jgi:hypothetical protein
MSAIARRLVLLVNEVCYGGKSLFLPNDVMDYNKLAAYGTLAINNLVNAAGISAAHLVSALSMLQVQGCVCTVSHLAILCGT